MTFPNNFGDIAFWDVDPIKYYYIIVGLNMLIQEDFAKKVDLNFKDLDGIATILLPGSDGRMEAGSPMSKFDLITILDFEMQDEEKFQAFLALLKQTVENLGLCNFEIKDTKSIYPYYKGNPNIVQPGRIADSRLIRGTSDDLRKAKTRLATDLISLPASKIDRIDSLVRDAKKVTESGVNKIGGQDRIHFDLKNGIIFFNPETNQLSFKVGPLRLVQNVLLRQEVKHVRNNTKDSNFFNTIPTPILDRLDVMKDNNLLNLQSESISEIKEIYAFFLRLYHKSEESYRLYSTSFIQLDEKHRIEVVQRLARLQELMQNFKIREHKKIII